MLAREAKRSAWRKNHLGCVEEINSHNFIPRINNGFTSHILFHVLYKDINNGKNYKKISVLEAQAYLHQLVSSDVTK